MAGCRVLLPRAQAARDILPETLRRAGARVDVVSCYETVRAEFDDAAIQRLRSADPDLAVFTSSSAIRGLIDLLGQDDGIRVLMVSAVAVLGSVTAATAESFGKSPEIIPEQNTVASLIEAIRCFYSKK